MMAAQVTVKNQKEAVAEVGARSQEVLMSKVRTAAEKVKEVLQEGMSVLIMCYIE